jgi:hypothetical protein
MFTRDMIGGQMHWASRGFLAASKTRETADEKLKGKRHQTSRAALRCGLCGMASRLAACSSRLHLLNLSVDTRYTCRGDFLGVR